ncbi:UNVERIFIED_CONTAM: TauD/TfdA family dioxygenase, partial [Salmonella enterica subsp. enterica serovar Weltevreden]
NEYLGTSPRDALTDFVFSASELPGYYPIPQHCEMTFTRTPPRRIFFWCGVQPRAGGGETPMVDFRRVWADLDPAVRERFVQRGLRIVRNYSGPDTGDKDLWQLKRWDEM